MRKMLRSMVFGVAAAVATAGTAVTVQAETLADALIAAYRNSNLLEQNRATLRAADEDYAISISSLRPVVSYAANAGKSWVRDNGGWDSVSGLSASISLSAELTLVDFGRRQLGIELAKESVLATRQALVNVEQQVLLAAVQAYVNVRLTQEIVLLRQSNVRLITQELNAARDRFEVGEITRTDVSQAEAALASAQALLVTAEGNHLVAREAYKVAVGSYPGRLAALPASPSIGRSVQEARAVALRTHPTILSTQHQVKASELNVALAEAAMKPTVGLGLTLSDSNTTDLNARLGLSMNQTIYAGGANSARYRKAVANKEATFAGLRQTVVLVEQNLANAWSSLDVYRASITATDGQIRAAQAAFDGVREEAQLGARTTLDVLEAEQDLLNARASRLEAEANRYVAVYAVLSGMGLLTADHLKLGIPTYDPEAYFNAVKNAPSTSVQGKKLDRVLEKLGK